MNIPYDKITSIGMRTFIKYPIANCLWRINRYCNYNCSYCWPHAHTSKKDFLDEDHCILLGGTMQQVPQSAVWENIIIPQSKWFVVDDNDVKNTLLFSMKNNYDMKLKAKKLAEINREKFSHDAMTEKLGEILDTHLKTEVKLNLPKLKKVDDGELKIDMEELDDFFMEQGTTPNKYIEGVE